MDLVSRLKLFLNQNGISNSLFADTCGIPRPTLSQLLNGRNKKVSDEIIAKIHASYPSLSIMWLMFGDGDMFVPNANSGIGAESQLGENAGFADSDKEDRKYGKPVQQSILFGDVSEDDLADGEGASDEPENTVSKTMQTLARATMPQVSTEAKRGAESSAARRVVSIMVFYSDNSFETFTPGK